MTPDSNTQPSTFVMAVNDITSNNSPVVVAQLGCVQEGSAESIRAILPNAEEMDEDELQQMADNLNDAQTAAARHTYAVSPATSVPLLEDDIAALAHTPSRFHQHPGSQHHKPKCWSSTAFPHSTLLPFSSSPRSAKLLPQSIS
ncbi:hypothetical protein Pmani_013480 [Petrolisthes manimaculis]|uniref:Uncharacterized protein n=1 Tax=Petrolisthes manimaculis TaxID=1843537 RepID=A0AAE1PVW8_9EUCA|nr:hypothetical protein Pmani_013480 [Petrolisthes manimaculis]